jgi:hypothetical protein
MPYGIELLRLNNMFGAPTSPSRGPLMDQMPESYMTEPMNFPIGNPYEPVTSRVGNPFETAKRPIGNPFGDFNEAQVDFGPPKPIEPMGVRRPGVSSDLLGMIEALNKARPFETRASDRFNNLLDNAPEREDPGFLGRLAGMGAYLGNRTRNIPGGFEAQEKAMYAPYYRELADWTAKTAPFQQAATIENTGNANERTQMGNFIQAQRLADTSRLAELKQEETTRSNMAKEDIARQRNAIAEAARMGARFETRGENIIALFPNGTARDTGVKTTIYSPMEVENLRHINRMEERRLQNQGALDVANTRQTGQERPGDVPDREQNAMRQEYSTSAIGQKWIEIGDDGLFRMKPPPVVSEGGIFGIGAVPQSELDEWTSVAQKVFPGAFRQQPQPNTGPVRPPTGSVPRMGEGNMTPLPPNYRPGGVGPQAPPVGPMGGGGPNPEGAVPNMPPAVPQGAQSTGMPDMPQLTPEQAKQQAAGLANGSLVVIEYALKPELRIVIPNNYKSIEDAVTKGWLVVRK